ncbi:MAG: serine hydrolase domain-containing protein, partial [Chthoniobacterales bacterium]
MTLNPSARLAALALLVIGTSLRADTATDRIAALAAAYVNSGEVPGIVVGISRAGAAPVVIARGVSDIPAGTPMNAANYQRIGSITKSFTVTRILQLADEGRLSLDDPISKYVP